MKLPDLDITGGPLRMKETLIEYDGPQLFIAENDGGARFLALHGPEREDVDLWLFVRTTTHRIRQLIQGKISLYLAITRFSTGPAAIVSYKRHEISSINTLKVSQLEPEFLPSKDSYFGDPAQFAEAGRYVAASNSTDIEDYLPKSLIDRVGNELWEFDPNIVEYFKANLTPLSVIANRRRRLVADLILSPDDHRADFPIPQLGKILINLQRTVDDLAVESAPHQYVPAALRHATRLDAIATFHSSFGLRIEAHEGSLTDGSLSEIAFKRLLDLLKSISNPDALQSTFRQHSAATRLHFGEVIKQIAKAKSSIQIAASSTISEGVETAYVSANEVSRLANQISEINEGAIRRVEFEGRLRAVSLNTKFFLIENEDQTRSGRISDELLPSISGQKIDARYVATLIEKEVLHELSGELESKFTLVDIREP